jgi:hypothetical protein
MKKKGLKAELNMNKLSVPAKINKARLILNAISNNPIVFVNPNPNLTFVKISIQELESVWLMAEDSSKKTRLRNKEANLIQLLCDLVNYVESIADGDESIIHLATLDVKRPLFRLRSAFEVMYGNDSGSVVYVAYVWQYTKDISSSATWQEAGVTLSNKTSINGLTPGVTYWFRAAIIDEKGKQDFIAPISLVVI